MGLETYGAKKLGARGPRALIIRNNLNANMANYGTKFAKKLLKVETGEPYELSSSLFFFLILYPMVIYLKLQDKLRRDGFASARANNPFNKDETENCDRSRTRVLWSFAVERASRSFVPRL